MRSLIEQFWPAQISLYPPDEAGLLSFALSLAIDGRSIGVMNVDGVGGDREPLLRARLRPGFHRYALEGTAEFAGAPEPLTLRGCGLIADRPGLSRRIARALASSRPGESLQCVLDELRVAASSVNGMVLPRLSVDADFDAPALDAELDAMQARLGIAVPQGYRRLLTQFGAFAFAAPDGEVLAALYSPQDVRSVPEWRREVRRSPLQAGNSARARSAMSGLERDFVVGRSQDMSWVLRAGTHPACADGSTSLTGDFIDEVADPQVVRSNRASATSATMCCRE